MIKNAGSSETTPKICISKRMRRITIRRQNFNDRKISAVDMMSSAHPFTSAARARQYEAWYMGSGLHADRAEKRLLRRLLARFPNARSVLEVGCGTGHFSRWLADLGYAVTGLDNSPSMLREARALGGTAYVEGDAQALPWRSGAFDLVLLITTLEFVDDPLDVLVEAVRVARRGVMLGVLNRTSVLAGRRLRSGRPPWDAATFFSPRDLRSLVSQAGRSRIDGINWRTTLWPTPIIGSLPLPWGGFIGMAVALTPPVAGDAS